MERIACQSRDEEDLARQALLWITFARSPLSTSQLQHALAVEDGEAELDVDNMSSIEDIIAVCAGLVTIDTQSNVVRLAHYTTQDYFERTRSRWFPDAETDIAKVCLTYISFTVFDSGCCQTNAMLQKRLQDYRLYVYAARNWGHHARETSSAALDRQILHLANCDGHMQSSAQVLFGFHPWYKHNENNGMASTTSIHFMSYFGLEKALQALLPGCLNPDTKDVLGRTPLSLAAEKGFNGIVQRLFDGSDIDSDSRDGSGRTPLSWAAQAGKAITTGLLLEIGKAKADSQDDHGRTPLSYAADGGHEAVVRRLLLEKVNVDSKHAIFGANSTSALYAL